MRLVIALEETAHVFSENQQSCAGTKRQLDAVENLIGACTESQVVVCPSKPTTRI